jgi:ParB-like chromosome segregation protein Spo0J
MNIEHLPITDISPDPANARTHGERNLEQIKASLRRFGQQKPIVIDRNRVVRAGNGTLAAAKSLGWSMIACVRSDLIGADMSAYAIADNRVAEFAGWDDQILAAVLSDPDIGDVGFDDSEIEKLKGMFDDTPAAIDPLPAERWLVIVTAKDEADQADLLERFAAEGLECKAVVG